MTEVRKFKICQSCFDSLVAGTNFVQLDSDILMDQIDDCYYVYRLNTVDLCDGLDPNNPDIDHVE